MKVNLYICMHCKGVTIIVFKRSDKSVNIICKLYLPLNIDEDIIFSEKKIAKKVVDCLKKDLNISEKLKIRKIFFSIDNKSVKNIEINIIGLKKDKDIKSVIKMKLQHDMDLDLEQNRFLYSKEKKDGSSKIFVWIVNNNYFKLFSEIGKLLKVFRYKIFCENEIIKEIIKKQLFMINKKGDLLLGLCYKNETKFCVISKTNIESIIYIKDNEHMDKSIKNYFMQIENKLFIGENKKNIQQKLGLKGNSILLKNAKRVECNEIEFVYLKFMLDYHKNFIDFNLNKNMVIVNVLENFFALLIIAVIIFSSITTNIKNEQMKKIIIKENEKIQQLRSENNLKENKGYKLKKTYSQNLKDIYNNIENESIKTLEVSQEYVQFDFITNDLNFSNKLIKIPLLENTYIKSIEKTNDIKIAKENKANKEKKKVLEIKFVSDQIKK